MKAITSVPDVAGKEPITLANLQFQTEVCFWCLFLLMHDFHVIIKWHSFWGIRVGVGGLKVKQKCSYGTLPFRLFRHFCCRMYHLATMPASQVDKQTDDCIIMIQNDQLKVIYVQEITDFFVTVHCPLTTMWRMVCVKTGSWTDNLSAADENPSSLHHQATWYITCNVR